MIKDAYDINEAATYAGFKTPWMVDYLCRSKILVPSQRANAGRGRRRLFSFSDLVVLRAINELLARGISVKRLALKLRAHRREFKRITGDYMPFRFLVTDGHEIFLDTRDQGIERIERDSQYCFRFFVDMHQARSDVLFAAENATSIRTSLSYRRRKK